MDFKPLSQDPGLDVTKYNILERWPSEPIGKLDASQWSALNQMLAKRLAIIQGPPGTGKTFTSLVALQMILANRRPHDPPIIIAAQTNHALDQLIRQVAVFELNYIRLGGRTTDLEIRKRTTYVIRQEQAAKLTIRGGLINPSRKRLDKITAEIKKLLDMLSPPNSERPIGTSTFLQHKLLSQEQADSLRKNPGRWQRSSTISNVDPIAAWLVDSLKEFSYQYSGDFGFAEDDIDREYEQLKEIEVEHGSLEDDWSTFMNQFIPFGRGLCNANPSRISDVLVKKQLEQRDLWDIPKKYRGAVYDYLRQQLLLNLREDVRRLAKDYEDASRNYQIGRFERDYCFLEEARIIGMTTTGLSKYRGLVSALNPRIILIEEAAEVLEAPIAVACLSSLEHLILVGDHQQLKGQCANHMLAGPPFYLDMSMFERLILNQMPYIMLQEQRRMIPEIRSLLTPIYGKLLHDHPSVGNLPNVPGMGGIRSFFFNHAEHESNDSLASKVNDFEASMVIKFLAYLVMNKVPPEKITVLTFYNGQKKLMMRKKAQNHRISLPYIKILTVDSYQGEENDIIILSLVRSNEHRGIGFLAQDNRVCVALSRAKYGFYIFGDSNCVRERSGFLAEVVKLMSDDKPYCRIGRMLPLHCKRHDKKTAIKSQSPIAIEKKFS
jgi:helicase required for RNAi-mediated heterochromatin assembly 1